MATESEFAPAKVNLTLHVTGRRQDGYHLLDSLVVFAGVGDRVSVTTGEGFSVTGPQAAVLPPSDDNLCLRAARAMGGGVAITLDKVLPVASGIGGGSADAAATLRALARMGRALPDAETVLKLGADVPVCLSGHAVRMTGVGEGLAPVSVPPGWMVLVNPCVAVSTPSVFRALERRENPPMPTPLPPLPDMAALVAFVASQRNDLEAPAIALAPVIADVKAALVAQDGCLLARMSGSGATCFGLFAGQAPAEAAARAIRAAQPGWWAAAAPIMG